MTIQMQVRNAIAQRVHMREVAGCAGWVAGRLRLRCVLIIAHLKAFTKPGKVTICKMLLAAPE